MFNGVYHWQLLTLCCPVLRTQVRETVTRVQRARAGEAFRSPRREMDLLAAQNFACGGLRRLNLQLPWSQRSKDTVPGETLIPSFRNPPTRARVLPC